METMFVAIDFDGVIVDFREEYGKGLYGDIKPFAKEVMQAFKEFGWVVIIHTARQEERELREFLASNNLPFDYINENPLWAEPSASTEEKTRAKPFAHLYIDDRGLRFTNWKDVAAVMELPLRISE